MKISIIIPTLNEAKYVRSTILHTMTQAASRENLEILVIDAGSIDQTLDTISDLDVRTFVNSSFKLKKYKSLNFGLAQAKGEVVLFLDADTLLPKHFDTLVLEKMKKSSVGGAFEMRFVDPDLKLLLLSLFNSLRYNIWKTCYGDQAIFCKTSKALEVGGFEEMLMEAAHFCKALKKQGRFRIIRRPVRTSPRRFKDGGFWSVFWCDVKMWLRFVFGLDLKRFQKTYWTTNSQNG